MEYVPQENSAIKILLSDGTRLEVEPQPFQMVMDALTPQVYTLTEQAPENVENGEIIHNGE